MSLQDVSRVRRMTETVPKVADIREWGATVSVPKACTALGISRSHGYELIKAGEFPFRVLQLRGRSVVVTSSIVEVLAGGSAVA